MRVLVTGSAGFIGYHVCRRLLRDGHDVFGFDGMTPYYDVRLKQRRNALLTGSNRFSFQVGQLEDMAALGAVAGEARPDVVIHLAAQAGVRYSIEHPRAYIDANVVGTFNVLEIARGLQVRHLLVASTSSVYGAAAEVPFVEHQRTDHPLSLYAATKKAGEGMAHVYAHLWSIPVTLFRFFTVYGPWGRPDMAPLKFVDAIENDRPIEIYNHGDMERDFTYIDDLVEGIVRLIDHVPTNPGVRGGDEDPSLSPVAPCRVVNIGRGQPVRLLDFIDEIERALGKTAIRRYVGMQPGDVPRTFASADVLERLTGFRSEVTLAEGVAALVRWYRDERADPS